MAIHWKDQRDLVEQLVSRLLLAGYSITVWDGEDYPLKRCPDRDKIMEALGSVEEEQIIPHNHAGKACGYVNLVYFHPEEGAPDDVFQDFSVNLSSYIPASI